MPKTSLGLDENIEGALCYVLGWVTGIIFLLIEKENKFVKFHALQSIIVFSTFTVLSIVLRIFTFIPFIGIIFMLLIKLIGMVSFVVWIICIVKAFQGEKFKIPFAGDIAEKI